MEKEQNKEKSGQEKLVGSIEKQIKEMEIQDAFIQMAMNQKYQDRGKNQKNQQINLNKQENYVEKQTVARIKKWFQMKRMQVQFLNYISKKIQLCTKDKLLTVAEWKYQLYMFILSKWCCKTLFKAYTRLNEGFMRSKAFTQVQFQTYLNNTVDTQREQLKKMIKTEFQYHKNILTKYIQKIKNRNKDWKQNQEKKPQILQQIMKICNVCVSPRKQFIELYLQLMSDLLEKYRQILKSFKEISQFKENRHVIQLGYLVAQSLRLLNSKNTQDLIDQFERIRFQQQNFTIEQLIARNKLI